jgi:uncharacterized protein
MTFLVADNSKIIQLRPAILALLAIGGLFVLSLNNGGITAAMLGLAGVLAGISLFQASFGFSASWRALVRDGKTHGLRVQLLMFALVGTIVLPLIAFGGGAYRGALAPFGVAVILGAFLFGIGMQIAGACASGSMYAAASGSVKSVVTIIGFIIGVTAAVASFETWSVWPVVPTVSLIHSFGGYGAVAAHLGLSSLALLLAYGYERFRRGKVEGLLSDKAGNTGLLERWPLVWGAIGLGIAALLIVLLSGRPWALISAYALWGSKIAALTGADVSFWGHWAANPDILEKSIFADAASVIDLGVVGGAMLAAAVTGRFALRGSLPLKGLLLALIGGIVMGFGARLSVGCNIGAFFSGIISGSMHGWVWGIFALAGTATALGLQALGTKLWSVMRTTLLLHTTARGKTTAVASTTPAVSTTTPAAAA